MLFFTIVKVAFKSILANKLRSFLTMLGVIIGVAAVIAMLGLGAGTQEKMTEQVRSLGANLLLISPQWRQSAPGVRGGQFQNLKQEDAIGLLRAVPDIAMVSPEASVNAQVKYFGQNKNYSVQGCTPTYFPVRNTIIETGRGITDSDVDRNARVAVIGAKVIEDLFGDQNPLGETIKVKGVNFTVVGTMKKKGDGWGSPDDKLMVPLNVVLTQLSGRTYLDTIALQIKATAEMSKAQDAATAALRKMHKIQVGKDDDFQIRNLEEIREQMENVAKIFTMLLAGVASVSLLVGGIGIMNIMLVTVTERTREIGVRKALGARNIDLLSQFLLEAVVVSLTGGMIGVALGIGAILGYNNINARMGNTFYAKMELWPVLMAFGFSFLVGVFFGWYPARKAARLDPIDALRYE